MTSPDGRAWTASVGGVARGVNFRGVAFGKTPGMAQGCFIAVGEDADGGRIFSSIDGVTWTAQAKRLPPIGAITFGRDRFVAVGDAKLWVSTDGVTFSPGAPIATEARLLQPRLAFGDGEGGGMFVITSKLALSDETPAMNWRGVTPDGMTFSQDKADAPNSRDLVFGAGHFVVVGPQGLIESSHDGFAWVRHATDPSTDFQAVTWTGQRFISQGRAAWVSVDGAGWSRNEPLDGRILLWAREPSKSGEIAALAIAGDGSIRWSDDFVHWSPASMPHGGAIVAIACGD